MKTKTSTLLVLRDLSGPQTLAAKAAVELPLIPLGLDPLTIAGDAEYAPALLAHETSRNLSRMRSLRFFD